MAQYKYKIITHHPYHFVAIELILGQYAEYMEHGPHEPIITYIPLEQPKLKQSICQTGTLFLSPAHARRSEPISFVKLIGKGVKCRAYSVIIIWR